ncbi:hypothetical protein GCM10010916_34310 [Paenibacillus abyssi]|uniref:Uncharacterized protein n=1 Tax=Paenibacillus abyssi TaxID=1340531 RepID=A0A917FYT4_9BACL|nr:hypothetical protein GCM10010916_34310 [Paenibacillus abyssi]
MNKRKTTSTANFTSIDDIINFYSNSTQDQDEHKNDEKEKTTSLSSGFGLSCFK